METVETLSFEFYNRRQIARPCRPRDFREGCGTPLLRGPAGMRLSKTTVSRAAGRIESGLVAVLAQLLQPFLQEKGVDTRPSSSSVTRTRSQSPVGATCHRDLDFQEGQVGSLTQFQSASRRGRTLLPNEAALAACGHGRASASLPGEPVEPTPLTVGKRQSGGSLLLHQLVGIDEQVAAARGRRW
jgi:hypothetical protein